MRGYLRFLAIILIWKTCEKADCDAQPMIQRQDELRQMRKASEKSK